VLTASGTVMAKVPSAAVVAPPFAPFATTEA